MGKRFLRIIAFCVLLFSVLFMPFWVSSILAFICMVYFSFFIEGVGLLLLPDLLYGVREARFSNVLFIIFIASILVFVLIEFMKKKLKFYPEQNNL